MPTTVTLTSDEALEAIVALTETISNSTATVQWAALTGAPQDAYQATARGILRKRELARKLTPCADLSDEFVDRMIQYDTTVAHGARKFGTSTEYDIDAAMAIDPASILAKADAA